MTEKPLSIWIVTGEESGDQLGAKLMRALKERLGAHSIAFGGVGGHAMEREGLKSLFPQEDIAVMGFVAVMARLTTILRRIRLTADAVVAARPDILVIVDSPDFTHRVAKAVRKRAPGIPIVDYVSPSVWAWRPGRAAKMRAYVDHLLALLPFEPEEHRRLGGPPTTYVGHPLIERLQELRPEGERGLSENGPVHLLVLPGSRRSEVGRLMDTFGDALALLQQRSVRPYEVTIPAVPHLVEEIARKASAWSVRPRIVQGEAAKWDAFRTADAALAASGTVTLELGLSGVPMVVAYKVSPVEAMILRPLIKAQSIVLTNLVLGENAIPELIQENCTPETLAAALLPLLSDTPERRRQENALRRLDALMQIGDERPSERASRIVADIVQRLAPLRR
ncbi:lipid-A-disaccharide synthase [Microvirga pudoricolor]|uniref:lipid-A-disaccharide synthase n=1 Tax=Microvirga pudoricolor TaxID=2778729 RepID=UPI0019513992|nr:lipid-A-disaccharide synthase [Microvirga pudoricolor]MBM6595761.1 lipid-A-disaccharide synthase [Microvirga pudoricolor]